MKNNNVEKLSLCDVYGCKSLKMYQPVNSFRMTSDSFCLAMFVNINRRDKRILDIGTGLGGIPLLLSRKTSVSIKGIEINNRIADIAKLSVSYNHLDHQITIINQDIKEYAKTCSPNFYDIIICNPPYYDSSKGFVNLQQDVASARHEQFLRIEDVFFVANKLLKDQGRLDLVFTTDRFMEVLRFYEKYHFAIKRVQFIYGGLEKNAKSFLIEGTKNGRMGMTVLSPLIWNAEGGFIDEPTKL